MPCCFVPGCRSGYRDCKEVRRFFKPPKDKEQFIKWKRAISRGDRDLTEKSNICDAHFSEDLIVKFDKFVIKGEEVLLPRTNWRLKDTSVPNIFPNSCKGVLPVDKHQPVKKPESDAVSSQDLPRKPVKKPKRDAEPRQNLPYQPMKKPKRDAVPRQDLPHKPVKKPKRDAVGRQNLPHKPMKKPKRDAVARQDLPRKPVKKPKRDTVPRQNLSRKPVRKPKRDAVPRKNLPCKPVKKPKRDSVARQNLPNRTLRRNAKRRKRWNPGARKLNISTQTVWLHGEDISVNTEIQDNMESGDCPVLFQEIGEPDEIFFKTELLTKTDNEENEGNTLLETTGEPEAVVIKTEPFTDEDGEDEQNPSAVYTLELPIKEEPEDNTVQTESLMESNMETVVVKEEITFEELDAYCEESSTEYECPEW